MNNKTNFDRLIQTLHDLDLERPDQQFEAAIALGSSQPEAEKSRVVDALIEALQPDHQALTRAHAAEALGKLGAPSAISHLIEATKLEKEEYQLVRSYAARALGLHGEAAAKEEVFRQLSDVLSDDPFFGARAEAAEALGKLIKLNPDDVVAGEARDELRRFQEAERKRDEERSKRVLRELYVALHEEAQDVVEAAERLEVLYDNIFEQFTGASKKIAEGAVERSNLQKELHKAKVLMHDLQLRKARLAQRLI